jgi:hypothetical protein
MRISITKTILCLKDIPFLHIHYEVALIIIADPALAYLKLAKVKHVPAKGYNYDGTAF